MAEHTAEPGTAQAYVELQRARILAAMHRPAERPAPDHVPLPLRQLEHLRREAEELYWNELSWEELTDEEVIDGGHLTELVFPAFLAFVDGLLVNRPGAGADVVVRPHPDAVEEILTFLAERYTSFTSDLERGIDSGRVVWARAMTMHLIYLVLYRLYRLSAEEREEVEQAD